MKNSFPLAIVLNKSDKLVEAWCPVLDIATQGKTFEEAKKNMEELINWYYKDKDTFKPKLKAILSMSISISSIPVKIGSSHSSKTSCAVCSKGH